jgi:transmembrane sensor
MSATKTAPETGDAIAAEAALWTVRTAGNRVAGRRDVGLDRWISEQPLHRAAFADASAVFHDLGTVLARNASPTQARPVAASSRPWFASSSWFASPSRVGWASAVAASLVAVVGLTQYYPSRDPAYATVVGEQRTIRLADASKVVLNTDTRMRVIYDDSKRRIILDRGEALFEVTPNAARPFYVEAGNDIVRAVGTAFTVRRENNGVEVTLLNGKVVVGETGSAAPPVALKPGDRLRMRQGAHAIIDQPVIDDVTAWRRGQLVFDATPVATAIEEMNRYSARPIILRGKAPSNARVSGVFETGENEGFARNLAVIYGLKAVQTAGGYTLQATPQK